MKIAIIGYGRMGHAIEQVALQRGHTIVARIDVDNRQEIFTPEFAQADVAIEFTAPTQAYDNCLDVMRQGVKVVSGSTGWNDRIAPLKEMCQQGRGTLMQSSNFSIGMNIFMMLNRYLTQVISHFPEYKPVLTETHHIHKVDHPSGTAITLAEGIIECAPHITAWRETALTTEDNGTQTLAEAGETELPIRTIRSGEVPGIHTITWESEADQIQITHDAHSRKGFATGAVIAAEWLSSRTGWHTMLEMMQSIISTNRQNQ